MSEESRKPFHEDYLAEYYYVKANNEVDMRFKSSKLYLEASVLIETLAELIIAVSKIQCEQGGE